ncbi:MAG TPA: hypothetical protein VFU13_00610 [Steroidobacteraceae bacterium]|nr:hypothetical protein [Steroidobacteraceae bacterium]
MRHLTIVLNALALIGGLEVFSMPVVQSSRWEAKDVMVLVAMLLPPLVSLIYALRIQDTNTNSFVSLDFRRRAVEERAKIRKLESE